jgi:hypothetical protein
MMEEESFYQIDDDHFVCYQVVDDKTSYLIHVKDVTLVMLKRIGEDRWTLNNRPLPNKPMKIDPRKLSVTAKTIIFSFELLDRN